jgi:hypothetical protein
MGKGWKSYELRLSRDFGTERIPVTGERHGADAETAMFKLQMKCRRALPIWLFDWLGGICATAKRDDKIGVLILKTPHMEDADSLVVLRYSDFIDLHGPTKYADSPHRVARREKDRRVKLDVIATTGGKATLESK